MRRQCHAVVTLRAEWIRATRRAGNKLARVATSSSVPQALANSIGPVASMPQISVRNKRPAIEDQHIECGLKESDGFDWLYGARDWTGTLIELLRFPRADTRNGYTRLATFGGTTTFT